LIRRPPRSPPFPYTTLFRSVVSGVAEVSPDLAVCARRARARAAGGDFESPLRRSAAAVARADARRRKCGAAAVRRGCGGQSRLRSEEHTSELQSQSNLVCRL